MGFESPKFEQIPTSTSEKSKEERIEEKETEIQPDLRQQNKIIKIIETGNLDLISEREVEVTPEEKEDFLKNIREGKIEDAKFEELLENIKAPFHEEKGIENLYEGICKNEKFRKIYQELINEQYRPRVYADPEKQESIYANLFWAFLKDFSTPSKLESKLEKDAEKREKYLETLPPGPYKENLLKWRKISEMEQETKQKEWRKKFGEDYKKSFEDFKHFIYGKRQEYWDQIKLLKKEAEKFEKPKASPEIPPGLPPEAESISPEEWREMEEEGYGVWQSYPPEIEKRLREQYWDYPEIGATGLRTKEGIINGRLIWCDGVTAIFETPQGKIKVFFDDLLAPEGITYGERKKRRKEEEEKREEEEIIRQIEELQQEQKKYFN